MPRFAFKKSFTQALVYDPDLDQEFVDQLWTNPNSLVESCEPLIRKDCVRTTVRLDCEIESFVIKRHVERSWRHFVKQCVSKSRAEKCWNDTWYLFDNGYPTPRPVAFLENRLGILRGNSYYVYQFVRSQTLKAKATGSTNQRHIRNYITQLVEIWGLHDLLNVNLSDGHPANFLIDATGKMWVIDLDKLKRLPPTPERTQLLQSTFERTLRGMIWEPSLISFGIEKLRQKLSTVSTKAA